MKFGLGTAQFGLDYGIANAGGRASGETVRQILEQAARGGVRLLDTAYLYGTSETVLGEALPVDHPFRVVTKTPKFGGCFGPDQVVRLRAALDESRARLRAPAVYGLLVHDADDLLSVDGRALWAVLQHLRAEGLVCKVGASVYSAEQIDRLLSTFALDLVQLPLSVLDQRLLRGGQLQALKAAGVEVHARSVLLQGLLLMNPDHLPRYLAPLRDRVRRFQAAACAAGTTPLAAALGFVAARPEIDHFVLGVCDNQQLTEALAASAVQPALPPGLSEMHCDDERLVNPSHWKLN